MPVEFVDGILGVFSVEEINESKSARLVCVAILCQVNALDRSYRRQPSNVNTRKEGRAETLVCGAAIGTADPAIGATAAAIEAAAAEAGGGQAMGFALGALGVMLKWVR